MKRCDDVEKQTFFREEFEISRKLTMHFSNKQKDLIEKDKIVIFRIICLVVMGVGFELAFAILFLIATTSNLLSDPRNTFIVIIFQTILVFH